ncbi:MAG: insulinase family protein [Pyrinomonadaceae bacterium]|nr:insulinase family protein [Phycisphaerales bacterium]
MSRLVTRRLDCGMPLIVESIPGVRSVAVAWYVPAGSATEPVDRLGLGAMWSELLQRGCGDLDSRGQADALDRLGMSRSVENGTLFMRFGFTLVGSRLSESMPIMADMVRRPRFDEDSIEPVRDLSMQAIESLKDEPAERASLTLRERHNPPPINRSGMGTPETLAKITRADLLDGWHERTRPEGAILAVAGEVDSAGGPDGIARTFNTLLADWRGGSTEPLMGLAEQRGSYHHISDTSAQVHIVLAYDAPNEISDDAPSERVLSSVLSGGMSARLFTEVREKRGLCYSVSQSFAAERDWGQCSAYVGTTPERAQESLNVLVAELRKAVGPAAEITPEEFAVALTGMKSRIIFSGESTSARAHTLASDQHKRGRPRSLDEIAAVYDALTPEKVNAYVKRRAIGPITIVTLGQTPLQPPM